MMLRKKLHDLWAEIDGDIDRGECFYDENMLKRYLKRLDKLKEVSLAYFKENQEGEDDEQI